MENMEQLATPDSEVVETPTLDLANPLEPHTDEPNAETQTVESDDGEEIDYEGEKYKVPAKLKEAFLRQQDYTVKTQSLADEKRNFEAAQQKFVQAKQFQQAYVKEVAKVISLDEKLEQFSKLDWNALTDADPVQALKLDRQFRELQQQRTQTVQSIEQAQAFQANESSQETARRQQEARIELAREIKGFDTPEVKKSLLETGKAFGYKPEELANVNDPRAVRLLHEAYLYRKLVSERKAEAKQTPEAKPITRISASKGEATRDPAKMSDSEFASWRRRQIGQRN